MGQIIAVNPFDCRLWRMHDRIEDHITEESCRAEILSFQERGQLVPVLGRRLREDSTHKFELIYGARRLFVARHVNKSLLMELRDISDKEALIAMDIENRQRKDISPYERGVSYARWLRNGHFQSQDELAQTLKVSASQVSRLLKMARLPSVIIDAFGSPIHVCEGWALEIVAALENPQFRQRTIDAARAITEIWPRPQAREVYRRLLAAAVRGRKPKPMSHDKVVTGHDGDPLFRIRYQPNGVVVFLPAQRVSERSLLKIQGAITSILQSPSEGGDSRVGEGTSRPSVA